jgi:hypothetical protein
MLVRVAVGPAPAAHRRQNKPDPLRATQVVAARIAKDLAKFNGGFAASQWRKAR